MSSADNIYEDYYSKVSRAEASVDKAQEALDRAIAIRDKEVREAEKSLRTGFVSQLRELFGDAPVALDIYRDKSGNLPSGDNLYVNGCRALPTALEKRVFIRYPYASVSPVNLDFLSIPYDTLATFIRHRDYLPSYDNTCFMPPGFNYYRSLFIPCNSADRLVGLVEESYRRQESRNDELFDKIRGMATCGGTKIYSGPPRRYKYSRTVHDLYYLLSGDTIRYLCYSHGKAIEPMVTFAEMTRSETPLLVTEGYTESKPSDLGSLEGLLGSIRTEYRSRCDAVRDRIPVWYEECRKALQDSR